MVMVVRMVTVVGVVRMVEEVRLVRMLGVVWVVNVVGMVRMVKVVGVFWMVRVVGVVRKVTLLVTHYFVQSNVGWWSLLLDVLFLVSPSPTRVFC